MPTLSPGEQHGEDVLSLSEPQERMRLEDEAMTKEAGAIEQGWAAVWVLI